MIIDPHISMTRVSAAYGPTLYERVFRRVSERSDQPQGVMLNFSTIWHDEFVVGTVFRDTVSMHQSFVDFVVPEAENEMIESGVGTDISRDEFRLFRLFVEPDVESEPVSFALAEGIVAFTAEALQPNIETYRAIAKMPGFFDSPAEGRLAHIAHQTPTRMRVMTFWRSRELGERWNEQHLYGPFAKLEPGKVTEQNIEASWLKIHSFLVSIDRDDPMRNFVRESAGPAAV